MSLLVVGRPLLLRCGTSYVSRTISTAQKLEGTFTRHDENWAQRICRRLDGPERLILYNELTKRMKESTGQMTASRPLSKDDPTKLPSSHFRIIYIANGLPFIGFGFLDNAIMIVAGEYIDLTFASLFGLSTMAAAGLGNLVSDICGLGLAGYVERFSTKMGFVVPPLTSEQHKCRSTRTATILGRCTGITIGCLLGLFPLLFFHSNSTTDSNETIS
ncbi:Transmembrane protein 65 [Fasciola gigantica]|uniref:Transmembrane protein 65 n=1 Tax=Fasciola gigantica TaxID=46835 RepID=A0A504Z6M8_FASGI|nr:Transmembrane protein 65 [Fasciola gigantica]